MPKPITKTVSDILKSIPDNLIISHTDEREALKDLLVCVKDNEESMLKTKKGKTYQDPKLQGLIDRLRNNKYSPKKLSKSSMMSDTVSPYDLIVNEKFTYIQISNEDEARELLKLLSIISINQPETNTTQKF